MDIETKLENVSTSSVLQNMRNDPLLVELQHLVKENELVLPMLLSSLETNSVVGQIIKEDREGFIALLKGENVSKQNPTQ